MKLGQIVDIFRSEVDDETQPYLWTDDNAIEYAVDAENEAARRARLLVDSSTAAICQIAYLAGAVSVALDPRVIYHKRAIVAGKTRALDRLNIRDLDQCRPGWESHTSSEITGIVTDWNTGALRLYPIPTVGGTLNLTVLRTPLIDMNDFEDTPEIASRYHRSLVNWMVYRAYMKPDKDTYDPQRAQVALGLFEQEFGQKSAAFDESWIQEQHLQDDYDGTR